MFENVSCSTFMHAESCGDAASCFCAHHLHRPCHTARSPCSARRARAQRVRLDHNRPYTTKCHIARPRCLPAADKGRGQPTHTSCPCHSRPRSRRSRLCHCRHHSGEAGAWGHTSRRRRPADSGKRSRRSRSAPRTEHLQRFCRPHHQRPSRLHAASDSDSVSASVSAYGSASDS